MKAVCVIESHHGAIQIPYSLNTKGRYLQGILDYLKLMKSMETYRELLRVDNAFLKDQFEDMEIKYQSLERNTTAALFSTNQASREVQKTLSLTIANLKAENIDLKEQNEVLSATNRALAESSSVLVRGADLACTENAHLKGLLEAAIANRENQEAKSGRERNADELR